MKKIIQIYRDLMQDSERAGIRFGRLVAYSSVAAFFELALMLGILYFFGGSQRSGLGMRLDLIKNGVLGFVSAILLSAIFRVYVHRLTINSGFKLGLEYNKANIINLLKKNYCEIADHSESSFLSRMNFKTDSVIFNMYIPAIMLVGNVVTFLTMSAIVIYVGGASTVIAIASLGLFYVVTTFFTKSQLIKNSEIIDSYSNDVMSEIRSIFSRLRAILISGSREELKRFLVADSSVRLAQAENLILTTIPRIVIESVVYLIILVIFSGNFVDHVGYDKFVILGLAALRTIPSVHQIYAGLSTVIATYPIYCDNKISESAIQRAQCQWKKSPIHIDYLKFGYKENFPIIELRNITIECNDKLSIVGKSGSGKTTLIDLFSGLLIPTAAKIRVDGVTHADFAFLTNHIEYFDQTVFIPDLTIREYLKLNECNEKIAIQLFQDFEMKFIIEHLDKSLGANGIKLSGGQKQRLALIKSLVTEREIVILDEPTSALDHRMAEAVGKVLNSLDKTVIVVTHDRSLNSIFKKTINLDELKL